jgi:hypothetical protein
MLHRVGSANIRLIKGKNMFSIDTAIDQVQNGKKELVKLFIKNQALASAMIDMVDTQSEYTKKAFKDTAAVATAVADEAVIAAGNIGKTDYTKFNEVFAKAFQFTAPTSKTK